MSRQPWVPPPWLVAGPQVMYIHQRSAPGAFLPSEPGRLESGTSGICYAGSLMQWTSTNHHSESFAPPPSSPLRNIAPAAVYLHSSPERSTTTEFMYPHTRPSTENLRLGMQFYIKPQPCFRLHRPICPNLKHQTIAT